MFSLRAFIKTGLLGAVGIMADYQIILNAAGWLEKNVLLEEDLAEIQAALDAREHTAANPDETGDNPESVNNSGENADNPESASNSGENGDNPENANNSGENILQEA